MTNVKEQMIIRLTNENYDGLLSASGSCSCFLEDNNCPCSEMNVECVPGEKHTKAVEIKTIKSEYTPSLEIGKPWVLVE